MVRVTQRKGVPALYGLVTVGLVVAIASLALVVQQPPPPSIAEFAPNPQTIEEARQEQAAPQVSAECTGPACVPAPLVAPAPESQPDAVASEAPTTAPTPTPTQAPSGPPVPLRPCYGNPPRHTPDPHSPACVAEFFEGDNGGATAQGVTGTTIRVALPTSATSAAQRAEDMRGWNHLVQWANSTFELWGRRIEPVYFMPTADENGRVAVAQLVAEQEPFAALAASNVMRQGDTSALARHGIVTVASWRQAPATERELIDLDPFAWTLSSGAERDAQIAGAVVCEALTDRPARHASGDRRGVVRKFGILKHRQPDYGTTDPGPLLAALDRCGIKPAVREVHDDMQPSERTQVMQAFHSEGVTTILDLDLSSGKEVARSADAIGYHPEWFAVGGPPFTTSDSQEIAFFGIFSGTRHMPPGGSRQSPYLPPDGSAGAMSYDQMLLLASGIQGAGPELTPKSFARALRTTTWPNPGAGQAPYYQQAVGFDDDHSFFDDHLIWWLDVQDGQPTICYARSGRQERFLPGGVPANLDELLFDRSLPCE